MEYNTNSGKATDTQSDLEFDKEVDFTRENVPCEVIEELLPSYVKEHNNTAVNEMVAVHLLGCEKCNDKYHELRDMLISEKKENEEKTEKASKRKKTKKYVSLIIWIFVIFLVAGGIWAYGRYASATPMDTDFLTYSLSVNRDELNIDVATTSYAGIKDVRISEADGVVDIEVLGVAHSLLYKENYSATMKANKDIEIVKFGGRIVWANGREISPLTARLFPLYNPYVGDTAANGKIVDALNLTLYAGNFQNNIRTSEKPYIWTLSMQNDYSTTKSLSLENRFVSYAYILLAEIENLDEVVFEYTVENQGCVVSVTKEEATEFAGMDIKTVGKEIDTLEALVRKTGLSGFVESYDYLANNKPGDFINSDEAGVFEISVVNFATDAVYGIGMSIEGDIVNGGQAVRPANDQPFNRGEVLTFKFLPEDFIQENISGQTGVIKISVMGANGENYEALGTPNIVLFRGARYNLTIEGDAINGYVIK